MNVEVYADFLCPWCYIFKRRIAAALERIPAPTRPSVTWRSFELSPQHSRVPGPTAAEAMSEWWGAETATRIENIRALGAGEGLELRLDFARPVNTFDAHRMLHHAARHGLAEEMVERLFRAYHTEGLNLCDLTVLEHVATGIGLSPNDVRRVLEGRAHADSVRADERRAANLGVKGVPALVIDHEQPISGVLPIGGILDLLNRPEQARQL